MSKEQNNQKENKALHISDFSGSIVVSELKNKPNQRQITSNSTWFDGDYILFNVKDDYISITRPDLDYRGKVQKPTKQNNTYHLVVTAEIPFGKFEFDVDESTEDELVIYYR
jgi:hypothetical protein